MSLTPEARATRDRVIELLVDEEYTKRIAGGTIDKGKLRDLIRQDVVTQAREQPTWLRQQADRLLGGDRQVGPSNICPHCDLPFVASDPDATRAGDGLLYCQPSCADRIPFVSLDDWITTYADSPAPIDDHELVRVVHPQGDARTVRHADLYFFTQRGYRQEGEPEPPIRDTAKATAFLNTILQRRPEAEIVDMPRPLSDDIPDDDIWFGPKPEDGAA